MTLQYGFRFMRPEQVNAHSLRKAYDNHYLIVVHFCKNPRAAILLAKRVKKLPSRFGGYIVVWATNYPFSWFSKKFTEQFTSEPPLWFAPAGLNRGTANYLQENELN